MKVMDVTTIQNPLIVFPSLAREEFKAHLIHVFKNWKLLFENICENMCEWKNVWKYVKYCLKTKNYCLKIQIKHPFNNGKIYRGKVCP